MNHTSETNMLTTEQIDQYNNDGYCVVPNLLSDAEVTSFRDRSRAEMRPQIEGGTLITKGDSAGNTTLLKMWHEAGDDMYGYVARDERLVSIAKQIIGDEVYLYSHKMTIKEPMQGGAWEWHQDYGYWYQNRCLTPDMFSIWIALDPSIVANGCLQVLRKSHTLGRLDHVRVNDQTVVDDEYLSAAIERFDLEYVELQPGDGLVFHCNLLHRSDANGSEMPRWGYIASYNTIDNKPFRQMREYGSYSELKPVPAGTLMTIG